MYTYELFSTNLKLNVLYKLEKLYFMMYHEQIGGNSSIKNIKIQCLSV